MKDVEYEHKFKKKEDKSLIRGGKFWTARNDET